MKTMVNDDSLSSSARVVRAAVVGATLGVACLIALHAPWTHTDTHCGQQAAWGCLGLAVLFIWAVPLIGGLLSWPLLRLAGIRPAWQVAAMGTLVGWFTLQLYDRASGDFAWRSLALPFVLAVAYLTAAYLVTPGLVLTRRLAVSLVLLAAWPASGLFHSQVAAAVQADQQASELAAAGVPLLAPDLTHYRIAYVTVDQNNHQLTYDLLPRVTPSGPAGALLSIQVTVAATPPTFAPPNHCTTSITTYAYTGACMQVAPKTWRVTARYGPPWYLVREQGYLVTLMASENGIPESDLSELAQTLAPRSTGYFS